MIITPSPFARTFKQTLKKHRGQDLHNDDAEIESEIENLRERLYNIRNGKENTPLLQKRFLSLEDQETLDLLNEDGQRSSANCPECHEQYKKTNTAGRNVIEYQTSHGSIDENL